jgi:hypothetical protein
VLQVGHDISCNVIWCGHKVATVWFNGSNGVRTTAGDILLPVHNDELWCSLHLKLEIAVSSTSSEASLDNSSITTASTDGSETAVVLGAVDIDWCTLRTLQQPLQHSTVTAYDLTTQQLANDMFLLSNNSFSYASTQQRGAVRTCNIIRAASASSSARRVLHSALAYTLILEVLQYTSVLRSVEVSTGDAPAPIVADAALVVRVLPIALLHAVSAYNSSTAMQHGAGVSGRTVLDSETLYDDSSGRYCQSALCMQHWCMSLTWQSASHSVLESDTPLTETTVVTLAAAAAQGGCALPVPADAAQQQRRQLQLVLRLYHKCTDSADVSSDVHAFAVLGWRGLAQLPVYDGSNAGLAWAHSREVKVSKRVLTAYDWSAYLLNRVLPFALRSTYTCAMYCLHLIREVPHTVSGATHHCMRSTLCYSFCRVSHH